jgi:hypothetical protein
MNLKFNTSILAQRLAILAEDPKESLIILDEKIRLKGLDILQDGKSAHRHIGGDLAGQGGLLLRVRNI